jgi:sialic acid synthase SpsE
MLIVAEIGTAHGGSFKKAKQLIDASANSGADAVKFQWVYADEILHPDTGFVTLPGGKTRLYDRFKELEVSPDFYAKCADYVHSLKKLFVCSPFGLRSLRELLDIHPDAIKIASPELNHIPLLKALADCRSEQKSAGKKQVPVIISTGVSTLADIETALSIIGKDGVTLLHCITQYPAPETEYNLKLIKTLSDVFGIPCGVSDHSLDPVLVPSLSAAMGGVMVEKHITLSKKTDGLDDPVALEPEQFANMCYCIHQADAVIRHYKKDAISSQSESVIAAQNEIVRQMSDEYGAEKVEAVLSDGVKKLAPSEQANYGRTNRSIHFMRNMKEGETIKEKDIAVLRTEKILTPGISPLYLENVTGAILTRDVTSGDGLVWEDIIKIKKGKNQKR